MSLASLPELPSNVAYLELSEKRAYYQKLNKDVYELQETLEGMRKEDSGRLLQQHFGSQLMPYLPNSRFIMHKTMRSPDRTKIAAMDAFKSHDSIGLVTVSQNGITVLWDAQTGLKYDAMNIGKGNAMALTISPNGSVVAAGGLSCIVEVYSVGDRYRELTGHAGDTTLPPNDGANSWTFLKRPPQHRVGFAQHGAAVTAMGFAANTTLVSGAENGTVYVWDLPTESPIDDFIDVGAVSSLDIHISERIYAVGYDRGLVNILDLRVDSGFSQKLPVKNEVKAVKFMPDGHSVLCSRESGLLLWDLRSCSVLQTYYYPSDSVTRFDISRSGRLALVGTDGGHMAPVDLAQNSWLSPLPSHRESVSGVRIIDDTIITSSWDGTVRKYGFAQ